MLVRGTDLLSSLTDGERGELKLVFNASGAIFFPANEQHRDQKAPGISYEDDSRGNALAAMVRQGEVEVRQHRAFSDARVLELWKQLTTQPELATLKEWKLTYQGRILAPLT